MKNGDVLIGWYRKHKRTLPWRESRDPYLIWISEIILQQTRVSQGLSYYMRFISAFPNVKALANADVADVLKLWQGLGYYSRARNMHVAASDVLHIYNGVFPSFSAELMKLKGIGRYTSAAIASICFDEKVPVVDGNVIRLISRLEGVYDIVGSNKLQKKVFSAAEAYMQKHSPGEINQAMMEFGALQCVPGKPDCTVCPLAKSCYAFKNNETESLPVKKSKAKQRVRYFHYLIPYNNVHTILRKRSGNDVWKGLYEFPLIETSAPVKETRLKESDEFLRISESEHVKMEKAGSTIKHVLSHQIIYASFYIIMVRNIQNYKLEGSDIVCVNEINKFPVSRLIEKFIEREWNNLVSLKV